MVGDIPCRNVDVLNLNAEWTKNVYDTTNYNIAYDVIEYDYANDMIIRRFEKESNVDVKCSKAQYDIFVGDYGFSYHSISVQQFGNAFNASSKGKIVLTGITSKGKSVLICITFKGKIVLICITSKGKIALNCTTEIYTLIISIIYIYI